MNKNIWTLALLVIGLVGTARDANANNLDLDPGDSYPVDVVITSPAGGPTNSLFYLNSSYWLTISDSNFLIDANYASTGVLQSFNSVTITQALNTGVVIAGDAVNATLEWQATGDSGTLDAFSGDVEFTLVFKVKFTGGWMGTDTDCTTGSFSVTMKTSGNTMPYTAYTGFGYSMTSGSFLAVSDAFTIPTIQGTGCSAHKSLLASTFGLGSSNGAMDIAPGYPTYLLSGGKVTGS